MTSIQRQALGNGSTKRYNPYPTRDMNSLRPDSHMGGRSNARQKIPYLDVSLQYKMKRGNYNPKSELKPTYELGNKHPGFTTNSGTQTNNKSPYARTTPVNARAFYATSKVGQLLFVKRKNQDSTQQMQRKSSLSGLVDRHVLVNLAGLNYNLAHTELSYSSRDKVKSAEEIWSEWSVEGVAVNESIQADKNISKKEITVNHFVRGAQIDMHSLWPIEDLRSVIPLYCILKRMKVKRDDFHLDFPENDPWTPVLSSDKKLIAQKSTLNPMPFQLVPFVSKNGKYAPSEEDLEYEDEFGVKSRGKAIYIATFERIVSKQLTTVPKEKLMTDIAVGDKTAKIFVYLDPSA